MAPSLIIPKEYLPAGIIALSLTELHHVSPHNVLVERERTHIAGLIQQSFTGLADISAKAAATVSAFNSLQDVLKEDPMDSTGPPSSLKKTSPELSRWRGNIIKVLSLRRYSRAAKSLSDDG